MKVPDPARYRDLNPGALSITVIGVAREVRLTERGAI